VNTIRGHGAEFSFAAPRRLTAIPGVGRLIASLPVMKTPDPHRRREHSTAGKARPR
jgi:hypothetical protein